MTNKVTSIAEFLFRKWAKKIENGEFKVDYIIDENGNDSLVVPLEGNNGDLFVQALNETLPPDIIMYPVSIDDPSFSLCKKPVLEIPVTFNYDFLADSGKPNDNAPDSVRPDLHTGE